MSTSPQFDPSQPLKNQRHELFAQEIARGKSATDAYLIVYFPDKSRQNKTKVQQSAGTAGGRLSKNVLVSARVDWLKRDFAAGIRKVEITIKDNRIADYDHVRSGLRQLIRERGEMYGRLQGEDRPAGAATGLVVPQKRWLGQGKDGYEITEWANDTATLKMLLEYDKQAAIECGDWSEKRELTGKDGSPIQHKVQGEWRDFTKMTPRQLAAYKEEHLANEEAAQMRAEAEAGTK